LRRRQRRAPPSRPRRPACLEARDCRAVPRTH
jgi:hypothetical protein